MSSLNSSKRLGISVYPEHSSYDEISKYIDIAAKYGYSRIFMSLLAANKDNKDEIFAKFRRVCEYAKRYNFSIVLDVAPNIFEVYSIKYTDLKFFKEIGATAVRLDVGIDGSTESLMTYNEYDLDIELNISNHAESMANVLRYKPNKQRLVGCHNFYPQTLSGLDLQYFNSNTRKVKAMGIRTAAFVSSKYGKVGPWKINDGLPTLEIHRNLDIVAQAKYFFYSDLIDDVIIGNAFATEQELKELSHVNKNVIELRVNFNSNVTPIEKEIACNFFHSRRGDINSFNIRSTMSRITYKDSDIKEHDINSEVKYGNVYINNNSFNNYKAELLIALAPQKVDQRKNLIGKIVDEEIYLLQFIDSWSRFKLS
jgi:hypothetical protein